MAYEDILYRRFSTTEQQRGQFPSTCGTCWHCHNNDAVATILKEANAKTGGSPASVYTRLSHYHYSTGMVLRTGAGGRAAKAF